jgi:glucose/mannose transport system substrate-binding protein
MWTNRKVFKDAGLEPPKTWNDLVAAAPALQAKGIIPLSSAEGWPIRILLDDIAVAVGGVALKVKIYKDRDLEAAAGPEMAKVFQAMDAARNMVDPKTMVPQWNEAVGLVISGKAGANVMGDWAGRICRCHEAGEDYDCCRDLAWTMCLYGGDVSTSQERRSCGTKAQLEMASMMVSKEIQVAFNLKKGSLPMRADVDLNAANDCMKKGLAILADPSKVFPGEIQMMTAIHSTRSATTEFFVNLAVTPEEAQARFVDIIKNAPK